LHRLFGAIAVFAGWLSIGLGIALALVVSQLLGLEHKEGVPPPIDVYGISGGVVLWVFIGAALLLAVPMAAAMVGSTPRRTLRPIAVAMGLAGVALLPDPLGAAFGVPVIAGAVFVWLGAELIVRDTLFAPAVAGTAPYGIGSPTGPETDLAAPGSPAAPEAPIAPAPPPTNGVAAPVVATAEPNLPAQPAANARRSSRKKGAGPMRICPWCSTEVPAASEICPNCQAALTAPAIEQVAIPGVTEVSPELRRYANDAQRGRKPSLLRMMFSDAPIPQTFDAPEPSDADALRPPSSELKAEMARLDAEIALGAIAPGPQDAAAPEPAMPEPAPPATTPETPPATTPHAAATTPHAPATAPPAARTRRRGPRT
jgi:hypothetical protein